MNERIYELVNHFRRWDECTALSEGAVIDARREVKNPLSYLMNV